MKRLTRVLALLLIFGTLPAVATDKAKALYKQGLDAEMRQDYVTAYNFYHQAYDLKPADITYRASFERVRFFASAAHVHKGQLLEKSGKLQEALTEFEQAIAIDPSSFIAQQEANKVRRIMQEADHPGQPPPGEAAKSSLHRRMEEAAGPVELAPISNTPITLKLSEDTKTIYETIGKLAGINVLFDPDYTSRRIRVELNGVTLQEALEITALESKTFWRPVTPNTIFVAADTAAKRKELEQSVIRTFYLTNLSQPNELQDLRGEMAGEMALALRNSLATISSYAQQLAVSRDPTMVRQLAVDIVSEAADLDHTIGGFLAGGKAAKAAGA